MSNELYLYGRPTAATVTLLLDDGTTISVGTTSANGRDDAYRCVLPTGTTTQGGVATLACPGKRPRSVRGIVTPSETGPAMFQFDDFGELEDETTTPPQPEPGPPANPYADPAAIAMTVFEQGYFDLATKQGCGEYTEAVVEALHAQQSDKWGHIRKTEAQNNYDGHAVDAVLLLVAVGDTAQGCYDIIWSTESAEARPNWAYKGEDPNAAAIWYYGPMPCPPL